MVDLIPTTTQAAPFYSGQAGVHDEMVLPNGMIRPAWQTWAAWFRRMKTEEHATVARKIDQLIFENFADPQRGNRQWRLDTVPLILDHASWRVIQRAAEQRARLYNALLADLYGEAKLLSDGVLPPGVVLANRRYLRPARGVNPPGGHLTFMALDFARDPNGSWRIIAVHTETPAGHGYALANRMVLSEVAGTLFRQCRALRIGQFYQSLTDDLFYRAQSDDPRIGVLAPSPKTSAFAGHAYLARYLGHLRVEGSDLRVVDGGVYLKTVKGLQKIHLLVRAVQGHRADPLELEGDGFEGPVGLLQAARHNPGLITNALGTALVESRALSPYLAAVSNHLLGEALVMEDETRLWLGDPAAAAQLDSAPDDYRVLPAHPAETPPPGLGNADAPAQLILGTHGLDQVAEARRGFATAPSWRASGLAPRPYALRVFVSQIGGEFKVMPGGLAFDVDDVIHAPIFEGRAQSRDVWVKQGPTPDTHISLRRITAQTANIPRERTDLQSRLAENLYWLGRYTERADGVLRVLRQTLQRSAPDLLHAAPPSHRPFVALRALVDQLMRAPIDGTDSDQHIAQWLGTICTDIRHRESLPAIFEHIRQAAVECRDFLSEDCWHTLNGIAMTAFTDPLPQIADEEEEGGITVADQLPISALDIIEDAEHNLKKLAGFSGLTHENMTHNDGFAFLMMGRRLERAEQVARLLHALFRRLEPESQERDDMIFALQACDSYLTFRGRYRFAPRLEQVLDLLLIDETNPRGLAFQLVELSRQIDRLPKAADDAVRGPDQRVILDVMTQVRLAELGKLAEPGKTNEERTALAQLLERVVEGMEELSDVLSRRYFSLANDRPQRARFRVAE